MTTTTEVRIRDLDTGKIFHMTRGAWLDMISRGQADRMYEIEV